MTQPMSDQLLRVMISSRTMTRVLNTATPLKKTRRLLKDYIQKTLTINGNQIFEVWICEDDTGNGVDSWWKTSTQQIRKADIILVLYTGEAGSQINAQGPGICHAEYAEAMQHCREKVAAVIDLSADNKPRQNIDVNFQKDIEQSSLWPNSPNTLDDLQDTVGACLLKLLVKNVKLACRSRYGAQFDRGNALNWAKLNFSQRKQAIEQTVFQYIETEQQGKLISDSPLLASGLIEDKRILWSISAIPGATSLAAARELVGQPFFRDYDAANLMQEHDCIGPVHIIGCNKTITENQALKMIGMSDCTVVRTPFGIYLADNIRKIQMLFLANCRDQTTTDSTIQTMFVWLNEAGELDDVIRRAQSRCRIVTAIADEQ